MAIQPASQNTQAASLAVTAVSVQQNLTVEDATKQAIKAVFSTVDVDEVAKLKVLQTGKAISPEYDRKILGTCRALLGRDLANTERAEMRKIVLVWLGQP